ncbi:PREDICTED: supervillin-like isoform X2 [Vollenhovia emeryi]|uniref:supervillin-like isoform X2 n=1 Tax=Vollenhovia emeryi TaxID=411798 RepID=UPI0005F584DE|nr:PREDICTED: supervillin-like isoform X2 [Vollenhovia emeryi]
MVAAGATVLMAASEENSSNETESTARSINHSTCSRYSEIERSGQRNLDSIKGDVATCSLNIKSTYITVDKKQRSPAEKIGKIIPKAEPKDSSRNFATCKTAQIRETRTSRLRAASIVLPNDVTLSSKKLLGSETPDSQRHNFSSAKQKNSTSLDVTMNSVKERDKTYKRKSYLNRSRHVDTALVDHSSEVESSERHPRRQYIKRSPVSETVSSPADSCRQLTNLRRKHIDSKAATRYSITKNLSKVYTSPTVMPAANAKRPSVQQSSGGAGDSEVSRKVDELTALTRATMERVERLASANQSVDNAHVVAEKVSMSPKRCVTLRHTPVSILKHKTVDGEGGERQASSSGSHAPSPVTFSPSVTESVSHKRHGILKKRSSLDENEILRRRSCSPDVSFADNVYSEFRPILKNQRRSSLDEIVKRDQSPDQQPASILKRKSSREDDRETHRLSLGSPEPQSILKRKLANSVRANSVTHHVTIASDLASTAVSGNTIANASASLVSESLEGSEVRPILKKKYGKEELVGGDVLSLEPRPILKKKSSTESDEHEHDRPKKTILKSSRKNSYEEAGYETESTSPRKLSVLRNRASELENVRPILKQSSGSRYYDDTSDLTADSFLRKRAQSVGHARSANSDDSVESSRVLAKRRSLESSSPIDVLYTPTTTRRCFTTDLSYAANSSGVIKESKLLCEGSGKIKQVNTNGGMEEKNKVDSHIHLKKSGDDDCDRDAVQVVTRTIDKKEAAADEERRQSVYEDYAAICRSNSVSKMTQHFKVLQEKANAASAENGSQRTPPQRLSRGIQRYRERKVQGGDRFNTQPVTLEEVREAVLQNQRNAATLSNAATTDNEPEPSKLSLVERVRLFDEKIATTTEIAARSAEYHEKFSQSRRQSTRYKTQPVTSEEVQVASRISPLNHQVQALVEGRSKECQRSLHSPPLAAALQHDVPKSILKSSSGYTQNLSRAKSPELQGMKLIKSVLKKESEESEQATILPSSEIYPRSILKSNSYSRPIQTTSVADAVISRSERGLCSVESENSASETAKFREKLDCFDVATNHNTARTNVSKQADNTENEAAVPSHRAALFRNDEIVLPADVGSCTIDTISSSGVSERRSSNEGRDGSTLVGSGRSNPKAQRVLDIDGDNNDDDNKDEKKDDNDMTRDEKLTSVAQCPVNLLAKSVSQHSLGDERWKQRGLPLPGLCRSATQVVSSIETSETPSVSIADRLAALRHNGNTNWKRRVLGARVDESCDDSPLSFEESTVKSGVLADCIEKLGSAAENWKNRIATPDAVNFTVAGKMKAAPSKDASSPFLTEAAANTSNQKKRVPRPQWFKIREDGECNSGAISTPTSPCKDSASATRTSFSEPVSDDSGEECKTEHASSPSVSVPKMDDETFTSFFSGMSLEKCETECLALDETDFDIITPQSELLVQKRNIRAQRRRAASKNPLKVLAARTDLKSEYTEIRTTISMRTTNDSSSIRKVVKSSSFAVEALAGLASTEDFSTVTLRNVSETSVSTNKLQPYKDIMLILIKGRRHVQARLIEPVAESINNGDSYILVTKSEVFNYIGKYSNVIEKTRAAEIASSIQQQKDLGCQAVQVITINDDKLTCSRNQVDKFWSYLGVVDSEKLNIVEAGHPDEDELYESAIIDTNMVYELKDEQLVSHEKFWGTLPKIEMLDKNKILVFDFGTEMYIWSGKEISADKKKLATRLATEMWNNGYDYSECTVCPISATRMIGNQKSDSRTNPPAKMAKSRPKWCLLAKLTQHVETILFREKFLDWPNVTGAVKTRGRNDNTRQIDSTITVHLDEKDDMWLPSSTWVDFILEGCHLGRGTGHYDNELKKEYVVATTSVMVWHIDEFSHTLLDGSSIGQFYSGDSYIVQWTYSVTITGRELSGLPSKHSAKGRDRFVYFIWQGRNASLNERGAAALLTVELDSDRGPQIHVVQGHEPAAFLNLFSGRMVVHSGKKSEKKCEKRWRLYICRGTLETETFLIEIPCSTRQLRSRSSFILLDTENAKLYIWHGNNSLRHIRENTIKAANKLKENRPEEAGLSNKSNVEICQVEESREPEGFSKALGGINKKLYWSLETAEIQDHTPKLYHLSSISKKFRATEILCPYRADLTTPFPFSQDDLYQANQPALFLLDDKNTIWIWQGWWPDSGTEDQSGSKTVRWQAERRAAMTTAIRYWRKTRNAQTTNLPIYLIWAGLEPLQFINLFPEWTYRDDVAELNIEDGRNPGEILTAENELARLTQSTYPPAQLLQRPLPDGVDPTRLELYLSQQHFRELLGMSKKEFQQLPVWKQVNLKKDIGLF